MAHALPEGLVSIHEAAVRSIEEARQDKIESLVRRFHKVCLANRNTVKESVGRRLENYFWRLWSSPKLLNSMTGEQIKQHFVIIEEGGYIRTTPRVSPRSSRATSSAQPAGLSAPTPIHPSPATTVKDDFSLVEGESPAQENPIPEDKKENEPPEAARATYTGDVTPEHEDAATPTPSSPFAHLRKPAAATASPTRQAQLAKPPPILKRTSTGGYRMASQITTTGAEPFLRTQQVEYVEPEVISFEAPTAPSEPVAPKRQTATRFSEGVTVLEPKSPVLPPTSTIRRVSGEACRTSKRKPIVVANTGASKRKPTLMRQRSSQTSQTRSSVSPPTFTSQQEGYAMGARSYGQQKASRVSAIPVKSISVHQHDGEQNSETAGSIDRGSTARSRDWRNVKANEVQFSGEERRGQHPAEGSLSQYKSFPSLSWLGHKSSAVTASPALYHASALLDLGPPTPTGPSEYREAYRKETIPLKPPASERPSQSELPSPLPRTKSQLTLLLERDKASRIEHDGTRTSEGDK